MKNTEFDLMHFNNALGDLVSNQSLNFAKVLFADPNVKLSVTASYAPLLRGDHYCTLDRNLNTVISTNMESFYYGVSPLLDSHKIIEAISQMRLSTLQGVDDFISDNAGLFMLHDNQEEYMLSFARYVVIAYSSNYGIRLQFPPTINVAEIIKPFLSKGCCTVSDDNIVCLHGCPQTDLLNILKEYRFVKSITTTQKNSKPTTVWKYVENAGEDIETIYSLPESIILLNGTVLYSGVLFKPLKVEKVSDDYENDGIVSIEIHFERSTYATVFSLDNNFTDHILFDDASREKLIRFFNEDDSQKRLLISNINEADNNSIFDVVTEYLMKCHNVNQIGVSGTIITKDGIAVFSQRNSRVIDGGSIYPGVNGNAEILDNDVAFYKKSVYEDIPTVRLNGERLDFQGEICREAYAELTLGLDKQMCICRGVVLSGNAPAYTSSENRYIEKSRRMHFNIIFEYQCDKTYEDLLNSYKRASESFENEALLGMRLKCYHSVIHRFQQNVLAALQFSVRSKDFLESLLLIALFFSTIIGRNNSDVISVELVLSLIFAVLILALNLSKGYSAIKAHTNKKKHIRSIVVLKEMNSDNIHNIEKSFLCCYKYHPATAATVMLYIENAVFNAFRQE